jgi:hypothetical protein
MLCLVDGTGGNIISRRGLTEGSDLIGGET